MDMHAISRRCGLAAVAVGLAAACVAGSVPLAAAQEAPDASVQAQDGAPAALAAAPAALTEAELDTVVATYTYAGETLTITARAAIEDSTSVEAVKNDDGTYAAPTADMILTCARNQILTRLVAEAGIEVSDEELAAYAEQTLGTGDFAEIAAYYQMDEDHARRIVGDAVAVAKLRDQVAGSVGDAPQPPTAPADEEGATSATEEYGSYVAGLLGESWDAASQTWADTDNAYYQALAASDFDGTAASYQTAQTAYYVAYALYQEQVAEQRAVWTDYVNGYLGQATISIATLRS